MKTWKVKEMIDLIEADGWFFLRQKGSHRHFRHPTKKGTVTIPGKLSDDLLPNTSKSILKQAALL
jgi:predicted RNA binding protein YcfA (HicA-like mRNA interferase family)